MDNGEIYKISTDGKVVGRFGKAGRVPGEFGMVNSLDCRSENTLWVGEVWNWRAQKVTLKRSNGSSDTGPKEASRICRRATIQ